MNLNPEMLYKVQILKITKQSYFRTEIPTMSDFFCLIKNSRFWVHIDNFQENIYQYFVGLVFLC